MVGLKKLDKSKDTPNLSNSINQQDNYGGFLDSLSKFMLSNFKTLFLGENISIHIDTALY